MKFISNRNFVIVSLIATLIMGFVVMYIVNPLIDGKNGLDVIALQLAFSKERALEIIASWDINNFKRFIIFDYIYALCYMLFFASLILWLGKKRGINTTKFAYIAILAGVFDWIENSLELWFLNNQDSFSSTLFFIHSILATLKWLALPIVLFVIIKLIIKKD